MSVRIQLNHGALRAVRNSPEVVAELKRRAVSIEAAAHRLAPSEVSGGIDVSHIRARVLPPQTGRTRARVAVARVIGEDEADARRVGLSALDAGRR
jgi:hypothetical protein